MLIEVAEVEVAEVEVAEIEVVEVEVAKTLHSLNGLSCRGASDEASRECCGLERQVRAFRRRFWKAWAKKGATATKSHDITGMLRSLKRLSMTIPGGTSLTTNRQERNTGVLVCTPAFAPTAANRKPG